jgi:hypothetical protein
MGGLGMVVTAMVEHQQSRMNVTVIMPLYRYLSQNQSGCDSGGDGFCPRLDRHISFKIRPQASLLSSWATMLQDLSSFFVSSAYWIDLEVEIYRATYAGTNVFLIGRGNRYPFNQAFAAKSMRYIYDTDWPISREVQNLYFCKAAAVLLKQEYWRIKLHVCFTKKIPLIIDA